ncbi:glycine betaine ABC transporter substrate-binding protein [Haloarculaceae archaeon H-GB2-1]|nr:glycine betaine ABC transporter substrate-binding protein [Haloarculaceae archaeon H-GB1-1]MEA5387824.1 glycine betaine ABC transporter substrate-binding protein [Haloarculaceae archaeon H-GB11]MEA5409324.1 glycine betaine ABC transporter substrate-binding protein [Haloarculaceae archaeon H-GB2-1]
MGVGFAAATVVVAGARFAGDPSLLTQGGLWGLVAALGIDSLSALASAVKAGDDDVTVAVESDFRDRSDGWRGFLDSYEVPEDVQSALIENTRTVENTETRYEQITTPDVDLIQGLTVDAWIDVHDLDILADPDNFFPIYNPAPMVNGRTATEHPELIDTLDAIGPTLGDASEMRKLVRQVKVGNKDPRIVAREHLASSGLL